jgi:hypothetical protein
MQFERAMTRLSWAALAVGPVGVVAAFFRDDFADNPMLMAVGLAAWELALIAASFVAKVFGKLQERWVDRATEWVDTLLRMTVSRYPRHYRHFLFSMHRDVDLRGLTTSGAYALPMEEIFVDLSLMPRPLHEIPTGPVAEPYEKEAVPSAKEPDPLRRSIWETLDRYPEAPLAVLGPPGSGKTTLLRHITLVLCRRARHGNVPRNSRRRIPILLFLREHVPTITNEPDIALSDVVRATLWRLGKREPPGWLDRQLDLGRCLVMLDGLDEVAQGEDRAVVMKWVRAQIAQYPRNRYIVTSRRGGFADAPLASATVVQVRPFTDAQVARFIRGWYLAAEQRDSNRTDIGVLARADDRAEHLLGRIYASPALLAMAPNPLLLTMIASVHRYRTTLPNSRAELYREICQVFLGKRQEAKGLGSDLSIEQKMLILRRLAFEMMQRQIRDISAGQAAEIILPTLERVGYNGLPAAFLAELEHTSGLLVERESEIYAFAHLTFQEYLAALHLATHEPVDYLVARIQNDWWREVILLWSATADATPIIQAIFDTEPLTFELLSLAADCVEQAREVDADVKRSVDAALSSRQEDTERRRLAAHVTLARKLRRVVRSARGGLICTEPITKSEFKFFLSDRSQTGKELSLDRWKDPLNGPDDAPIVGVGPDLASHFIDWARGLGLNAKLPEHVILGDLWHMARVPARRFWVRPWIAKETLILLSDDTTSPDEPDFEEIIRKQIATDATVIRSMIPSEEAFHAGLISAQGSVMIDTDRHRSWPPEFVRGGRLRTAAAAARSLASLPDEGAAELVPTEYWQHLPQIVEKVRFLWTLGAHWFLVRFISPASEWRNDSAMLLAAVSGLRARRVLTALDLSSLSIWTMGDGKERFVFGTSLSAFPDREGVAALGGAYGASSTEGLLLRSHHRFFKWGRLNSRSTGPLRRHLGNAIKAMRYTGWAPALGLDKPALTTELAQLYLLELHLQGALPRDEGILMERE